MGVGETGQIIGETRVGETGVGEMGVNRADSQCRILSPTKSEVTVPT